MKYSCLNCGSAAEPKEKYKGSITIEEGMIAIILLLLLISFYIATIIFLLSTVYYIWRLSLKSKVCELCQIL